MSGKRGPIKLMGLSKDQEAAIRSAMSSLGVSIPKRVVMLCVRFAAKQNDEGKFTLVPVKTTQRGTGGSIRIQVSTSQAERAEVDAFRDAISAPSRTAAVLQAIAFSMAAFRSGTFKFIEAGG